MRASVRERGVVNTSSKVFLVKIFMRHLKYSFHGDKQFVSAEKATELTATLFPQKCLRCWKHDTNDAVGFNSPDTVMSVM